MPQPIRSRSFIKWVGIPFVLLGGLLSQNRGYRDYVSDKAKSFFNPRTTEDFPTEFKEYCRRHINDRWATKELAEVLKRKDYNMTNGIIQVSPIDIKITRSNIDSWFAFGFNQNEDRPIEQEDLEILKKHPDSLFAKGLGQHPKLKEAIKKYGLENDPYFSTFLDE